MDKNTRYALYTDNNGKTNWYAYGSRTSAKRAVAYGEIKPGRILQGGEFTGEILTARQMQKRGLLS